MSGFHRTARGAASGTRTGAGRLLRLRRTRVTLIALGALLLLVGVADLSLVRPCTCSVFVVES